MYIGYGGWNFERSDLKRAAFGGRAAEDYKAAKNPVIFVHGNSNIGFGRAKLMATRHSRLVSASLLPT